MIQQSIGCYVAIAPSIIADVRIEKMKTICILLLLVAGCARQPSLVPSDVATIILHTAKDMPSEHILVTDGSKTLSPHLVIMQSSSQQNSAPTRAWLSRDGHLASALSLTELDDLDSTGLFEIRFFMQSVTPDRVTAKFSVLFPKGMSLSESGRGGKAGEWTFLKTNDKWILSATELKGHVD